MVWGFPTLDLLTKVYRGHLKDTGHSNSQKVTANGIYS